MRTKTVSLRLSRRGHDHGRSLLHGVDRTRQRRRCRSPRDLWQPEIDIVERYRNCDVGKVGVGWNWAFNGCLLEGHNRSWQSLKPAFRQRRCFAVGKASLDRHPESTIDHGTANAEAVESAFDQGGGSTGIRYLRPDFMTRCWQINALSISGIPL